MQKKVEGEISGVDVSQISPEKFEPMVEADGSYVDEEGFTVRTDGTKTKNGKTVLATADSKEHAKRMKAAKTDTARTGVAAGATDGQIRTAERLSKILGKEIRFYRQGLSEAGTTTNGRYDPKTDVIHVNAASEKGVTWAVAHELTHSTELSSEYGNLLNFVMGEMEKHGRDVEAEAQAIMDLYEKHGEPLEDKDEAKKEILSDFAADYLLTDVNTIRELVRGRPTLGQRILHWIDGILTKGGDEAADDLAMLRTARDMYASALADSKVKRADAAAQTPVNETAGNAGQNFAEDGDVDYDLQDEQRSRAGESMLEDDAGYDAESSYGDSNIEEEAVDAQIHEHFPDAQWSISKTSKMPYDAQLKQIETRQMNGSNSLYIGVPSSNLQGAGISENPFAMNQSDYKKSRRESAKNKHYSSHAVPYDFFEKMPEYLKDAPLLIDNGEKVTIVTSYAMPDTRGKQSFVIAGMVRDQKMENDTVNLVKSVYPLDDFYERIAKAADDGKLVVINKNKATQMLATIGIQPSEVPHIVSLARDSISQSAPSVKEKLSESRAGESMLEDDAGYDAESSYGDSNIEEEAVDAQIREHFPDAQWSISATTDGRAVAVVDSDILSSIDTSHWGKEIKEQAKSAAKKALLAFKNGIQVNGITYKVNKKSRDEYTRSNATEKSYRKTPDVFADKMRAAANADDIITATTGWAQDGGLEHPRDDNFVDFAHGDVLIQAGQNQYTAKTVVGITDGGEYVFYDVVDMEPTKFETKKERSTAASGTNAVSAIQERSFKNSISQTAPSVKEKLSESRAGESMLEDDAGYDAESSYGDSNIEEEAVDAQWSISRADESFKKAEVNDNIMEMIARVKTGDYRDNDKVYLGRVSDETAAKIKEITGIDVRGFKVAIEARQVKHILNNHGESGKTNQTMAHDDVIARMEYALENPDNIRAAGKTTAYFYTKDGRNKTADTVLYEKFVGEKSYYVVQAVADTKKKTLFVVTAFIGDKGYKTGTPQFADAKSPDATSKNAAAEVPTESISQSASPVKEKLSVTRTAKEQDAILSQMRSILQNGGTAADLKQYVDTLDRQERAQAKKKPQGTNTQQRGDAASQIVRAAHDAKMSVEEYLRENAELYETEDGWNADARRALQMEENGRGVKYSISPALKDDLQKVLEGKFSSKNNEVYIGESSTFLTDTLKAKKLRVTMPVRKAYAAMVTEEEALKENRYDPKLHYHGLGVKGLYDALVSSEDPVAAFAGTEDEKGNNRDDHIVLVTDKMGEDGNLVAVMEVDTEGYVDGHRIKVNKTITSYGRSSIAEDIYEAAQQGRLLHLDKKRSQSLFAGVPGSTSPGAIRSVDFENSIRHFWENVKWKKSGAKTFVAEPTGEQKTGMAYAFEKAQKKAEGKEKHSISGVHAVGADMEALARAKEMEKAGVAEDTILQDTGWYKGSDGKWRFEIDDSRMEYHSAGDADFTADHPEYAEYQGLVMKTLYGTITKEEEIRMRELSEVWGRERERLNERVERGNATLSNLIKHEELFQNYPGLRDTKVVFSELLPGENGSYNARRNEITLSSRLRRAPESTLLHEIQHIIQRIEDFAGGASPEYWADNFRKEAERAKEAADEKYRSLWNSLPDDAKNKFREINRAKLDSDWDTVTALEEEVYAGEYADLYSEITDADFERRWARERTEDYRKRGEEAYYNTAGEIEARDVSARRHLTSEQRREKMPDRGGKDVVFAEDSGKSFAYIGNTKDGRRCYQSGFGDDVSMDQRIEEFKNRIATIFNLGAVELKTDVKKIQIKGDKFTSKENLYGDHKGQPGEKAAKINALYDLADILATSKYDPSETNKEPSYENPLLKPKNPAHKGVKYWYKFKNEIVFDGIPYTVTFSIRDKGHEQYQYFIDFKENKTSDLSDTAVNSFAQADQMSYEDSIPQNKPPVKEKLSITSYETVQKPMLAKRDFRNRLMSLMSIPDGVKQKIGDAIEYYGEELIAKGRLEEGERRSFFNLLYSSGAMTLMADEYYRDIRSAVAKKRIYVSESVKSEFGDGWNDFRKKAFAAGVYLTHIEKYRGIFDKY